MKFKKVLATTFLSSMLLQSSFVYANDMELKVMENDEIELEEVNILTEEDYLTTEYDDEGNEILIYNLDFLYDDNSVVDADRNSRELSSSEDKLMQKLEVLMNDENLSEKNIDEIITQIKSGNKLKEFRKNTVYVHEIYDEKKEEIISSKRLSKDEFENIKEDSINRKDRKSINSIDNIKDKKKFYESDHERMKIERYAFEICTYVSLLSTNRDVEDIDLRDINEESDFDEFDRKSAYYVHIDLDYDRDTYGSRKGVSSGEDFLSVYWSSNDLEKVAEEIKGKYRDFYGASKRDRNVEYYKVKSSGNGFTVAFNECMETGKTGTVPIQDFDIRLILKPVNDKDGNFEISTSYNHTYYTIGNPTFNLTISPEGFAVGGTVSGATKSWPVEDTTTKFYY